MRDASPRDIWARNICPDPGDRMPVRTSSGDSPTDAHTIHIHQSPTPSVGHPAIRPLRRLAAPTHHRVRFATVCDGPHAALMLQHRTAGFAFPLQTRPRNAYALAQHSPMSVNPGRNISLPPQCSCECVYHNNNRNLMTWLSARPASRSAWPSPAHRVFAMPAPLRARQCGDTILCWVGVDARGRPYYMRK